MTAPRQPKSGALKGDDSEETIVYLELDLVAMLAILQLANARLEGPDAPKGRPRARIRELRDGILGRFPPDFRKRLGG